MADSILISKYSEFSNYVLPNMANRQGMIAGAFGTGKTVTLQIRAKRFFLLGLLLFNTDDKWHLYGLISADGINKKVGACPVVFGWFIGKCTHAKRH